MAIKKTPRTGSTPNSAPQPAPETTHPEHKEAFESLLNLAAKPTRKGN